MAVKRHHNGKCPEGFFPCIRSEAEESSEPEMIRVGEKKERGRGKKLYNRKRDSLDNIGNF